MTETKWIQPSSGKQWRKWFGDGGNVGSVADQRGRGEAEGAGGQEPDAVDGVFTAAEINSHRRGSGDKHKSSTSGYQRRTKEKVVSDFSTLSKGSSVGAKPRAALRQVLFSQSQGSEKTAASEERSQLDLLKQELETYAVPVNLKWAWKEESQGSTLEKNWTEIVHSTSVRAPLQSVTESPNLSQSK
ncbi:unnamed protein product [Tetraodon nigroviridis]|uniref:Chromosome 8 SCAF14543, whole genome shotgun sequence n=1 Tax=Tetraodon nigroviridis TaxID=99883 RepID=Q4SNE0_TETNG|nr:unnamed protein product [Tetraodon nigroviridis]